MPTSPIPSEASLHAVAAQKPLAETASPKKAAATQQPEVFYDAKESQEAFAEAGKIDTLNKEAPIKLHEGAPNQTPAPSRPPSVKKASNQNADVISLSSKSSKTSVHSSAISSFSRLNSDASSDTSSVRSTFSAKPSQVVKSGAAIEFGVKVAALAKQTKLARNAMPAILGAGIIASVGMLVFGHMAPLAIIGVLVGALGLGYVVAKALQLYQARKFAAMGDANPIEQLKKNIPEDASQADLDKLNKIVNFIEKGDVFEAGFVKTFRQPYRAVKQRIGKAVDAYQAAKVKTTAAAATPNVATQPNNEKVLDDAASGTSTLSEAEKYKKSVLDAEAFEKANPQAESEPLLKKSAPEA